MYNYLSAVKEDVKEYIENEIATTDFESIEELENFLNDELFTCDSVTGNASGSYTFNRSKAAEYVKDNLPLCVEACREFGTDEKTFGEKIYNEEYEWLDVTIRCYLLSSTITEALEELESELEFSEN